MIAIEWMRPGEGVVAQEGGISQLGYRMLLSVVVAVTVAAGIRLWLTLCLCSANKYPMGVNTLICLN